MFASWLHLLVRSLMLENVSWDWGNKRVSPPAMLWRLNGACWETSHINEITSASLHCGPFETVNLNGEGIYKNKCGNVWHTSHLCMCLYLCVYAHTHSYREKAVLASIFSNVDGKDLWCLKSSQGNEEQDVFRQRLMALLLRSEHSSAATTTVLMTHWWQRVNRCVIFQGHRLTGSESDHQPEHRSGEENKNLQFIISPSPAIRIRNTEEKVLSFFYFT